MEEPREKGTLFTAADTFWRYLLRDIFIYFQEKVDFICYQSAINYLIILKRQERTCRFKSLKPNEFLFRDRTNDRDGNSSCVSINGMLAFTYAIPFRRLVIWYKCTILLHLPGKIFRRFRAVAFSSRESLWKILKSMLHILELNLPPTATAVSFL